MLTGSMRALTPLAPVHFHSYAKSECRGARQLDAARGLQSLIYPMHIMCAERNGKSQSTCKVYASCIQGVCNRRPRRRPVLLWSMGPNLPVDGSVECGTSGRPDFLQPYVTVMVMGMVLNPAYTGPLPRYL